MRERPQTSGDLSDLYDRITCLSCVKVNLMKRFIIKQKLQKLLRKFLAYIKSLFSLYKNR